MSWPCVGRRRRDGHPALVGGVVGAAHSTTSTRSTGDIAGACFLLRLAGVAGPSDFSQFPLARVCGGSRGWQGVAEKQNTVSFIKVHLAWSFDTLEEHFSTGKELFDSSLDSDIVLEGVRGSW